MDVESRHAVWAAMRRFAATGRTVLFATHYLEEADDYADRVIVLAQGKVVADGTGEQIKRLAGGRTLSFIGDAEGLDLPGVAAVEVRGERVLLRCDDSDKAIAAFIDSRHPYRDLEITSAGLEEAFLTLTSPKE